mmetsp:Transcript_4757/g.12995  ORF Transcript_4757/g.12995 Transcript_4757/m.12995 type:complete len:104 (-) Transcript_4757:286-597(-)
MGDDVPELIAQCEASVGRPSRGDAFVASAFLASCVLVHLRALERAPQVHARPSRLVLGHLPPRCFFAAELEPGVLPAARACALARSGLVDFGPACPSMHAANK